MRQPARLKGVGRGVNVSNRGNANVYDLGGNPTTYKGSSMTWNPEDQLTGVGSTWTAGYRADGLRAWKSNTGTKTYFLYDGGTPVVEMDSSGSVIAQNVYGAMSLQTRHTTASHDYTFDLQRDVAQRLTTTEGCPEHRFRRGGRRPVTATPRDCAVDRCRMGLGSRSEAAHFRC